MLFVRVQKVNKINIMFFVQIQKNKKTNIMLFISLINTLTAPNAILSLSYLITIACCKRLMTARIQMLLAEVYFKHLA